MSVPNTPSVSFRTLNYREMVMEMWGPAFNLNDTAYEMNNGRKFDSTDRYKTGIYNAHLGAGRIFWLPAGVNPYPDMYYSHALELDPSHAFLLQEP